MCTIHHTYTSEPRAWHRPPSTSIPHTENLVQVLTARAQWYRPASRTEHSQRAYAVEVSSRRPQTIQAVHQWLTDETHAGQSFPTGFLHSRRYARTRCASRCSHTGASSHGPRMFSKTCLTIPARTMNRACSLPALIPPGYGPEYATWAGTLGRYSLEFSRYRPLEGSLPLSPRWTVHGERQNLGIRSGPEARLTIRRMMQKIRALVVGNPTLAWM